jgi:pimeloyl-ACP methyl ester carboxylesterase
MLSRRALLGSLTTLVSTAPFFAAACKPRSGPPGTDGPVASIHPLASVPAAPAASASVSAAAGEVDLVDWEFPGAGARGGAERVLVLIPKRRVASTKFPVLITHHGRGESRRGAEAGAYGWVRDYKLLDVLKALGRGSLTRDDFLGFVDNARLAKHNESLASKPYGEMIVVCPHTPDILDSPKTLERAEPYTDWLASELMPRIKSECPIEPGALGIDGVSLGGRMSLLAGLAHPELFRAVGTLQPAFQVPEAKPMTARAKVFHEAGAARLRVQPGARRDRDAAVARSRAALRIAATEGPAVTKRPGATDEL